jgi:hypothetical protein
MLLFGFVILIVALEAFGRDEQPQMRITGRISQIMESRWHE